MIHWSMLQTLFPAVNKISIGVVFLYVFVNIVLEVLNLQT